MKSGAVPRAKAVSGAGRLIGGRGRPIVRRGIQLHGGMGMTEEMDVGHYFEHPTTIDPMFGDHTCHSRRYAGP